MKKGFFCILTVLLLACSSKQPHPEYVEISGVAHNVNSKEISLYGPGDSKIITIQENGSFKDTLRVKKGLYQLMLMEDKFNSRIYLENGADIVVNIDFKDSQNIKYEQDHADYNNFLIERKRLLLNGLTKKDYRLPKEAFNDKIDSFKTQLDAIVNRYSKLTDGQKESAAHYSKGYIERFVKKYEVEHTFADNLKKGQPSPKFKNYRNHDGSVTSLSDFKGKFVFIDVWATWCAPCKVQIPFLEDLEKKYHDKNISFISISVDKEKDFLKWKKMVEDKKLTGIQLFADSSFNSSFVKTFGINAIPRFILIDPNGDIVDFDAPRPSNEKGINGLLSSLKL